MTIHFGYKKVKNSESLKTLKGKYCQIFDNDNTVTYLKYNL